MRIGVIVPSNEMGEVSVDIGKELGLEIFWRVAVAGTILGQVQELVRVHGVEAVVARSPVGYVLENLEIPVIILHISRMDILRAARMITPHKRIAFIYVAQDLEKYDYDIDELQQLPLHPIVVFPSTEQAIRQEYAEINKNYFQRIGIDYDRFIACDAVVSGSPSLLNYMKSQGKETAFIQFDPFELRCALRNAMSAVKARNREIRNTKLTEMALNTTNDGFLIMENRRVTIVNKNILRMAVIERDKVLFKTEAELIKERPIFKQIFEAQRKEIVIHNDVPYSVYRRTVKFERETREDAAIELISVIDVPRIQKTETSIRKALDARGFTAKWHFSDIITQSTNMKSVLRMAKQYAISQSNVLILGESGTGKEMLAQSIHNASPFAQGPFVALNCAALPENLLESELFGYEEGAFTGAKKGGKAGLFELSHNGTLFLDEIGEIPISLQAKLLRSIQEKCIYRLGGEKNIPVTNRLICATNQNLQSMVKLNRFRQDLLYRINILEIQIPPLRERTGDIAPLVTHFLEHHLHHKCTDTNRFNRLVSLFSSYDWPGNVRELENYMERLVVMKRGGVSNEEIDDALQKFVHDGQSHKDEKPQVNESQIFLQRGTMAELQQQILVELYDRFEGNVQKIARELDLGYSTVWRKLKVIKDS